MSPSNSSSSPKTDQRLNAIVVAAQETRKMTNPIQVSPQEVMPEMNNLKQVSPQEVMPEVNNPEQISPQEIVPEVDNLKQVSPQEVVHEVNNPKQVSPQEVVHEVNNPKQVSPQEVVPDLNNPKQGSPQEVVPERKKTERPSSDLRVLRPLNRLMKKYPSRDSHALICNICKRGFPNANSLCAHQKIHKHDLELERKLKQVEPSYSPGQCFWKKPYNFGGIPQDALSNNMHFGISRDSIGGGGSSDRNMVMGYPSAPPYGKTSYGFSSGAPLVTHNYNRSTLPDLNRGGISFGPFKPNGNGGGGNGNNRSLFNGGFTMAPPATPPYRPFLVNPSSGSLPNDSTIVNSIGSGSNNNNNNSSSQGEISLELTLGPSKWMGGRNNNRSVYPSLNGGVTGGGSMDLNMPVRPLVPRYHFYNTNPLGGVTRNVPPPPSPVTSIANDEDVPGSSSSKEKNKVVVVDDDDEKDN